MASNDLDKRRAMDRAEKARAILESDLFTSAFDNMRLAILARFEETPLRDLEGLSQLRMMLKLLHDVRLNLERAIADGKMAAEDLKWERERGSMLSWKTKP